MEVGNSVETFASSEFPPSSSSVHDEGIQHEQYPASTEHGYATSQEEISGGILEGNKITTSGEDVTQEDQDPVVAALLQEMTKCHQESSGAVKVEVEEEHARPSEPHQSPDTDVMNEAFISEDGCSFVGKKQEQQQEGEKKKTEGKVRLVVWTKDKDIPEEEECVNNFEERVYFLVKLPAIRDPRTKIGKIGNSSKRGRKPQSLKQLEHQRWLQQLQDWKNFKVDNLFIPKSETSSSSSPKRKRGKTGGRGGKKPKMPRQGHEENQYENGFGCSTSASGPVTFLQQFDSQLLPMPIDPNNPEHMFTVDLDGIDDVANFEQVDITETTDHIPMEQSQPPPQTSTSPRNEESQVQRPVSTGDGIVNVSFSSDDSGKPRCTYTDLIEQALTETGGLTVSEIYQWISERYPFFKPDDDRWKNSVRHNLSINPYFKKGDKARSGAGHLWTISEESKNLHTSLSEKDDFDFDNLPMAIKSETDRAVANILGQYHMEKSNLEGKGKGKKSREKNNNVDSLNTPPRPNSFHDDHQQNCEENQQEDKLMEDMTSNTNVVLQYENDAFPTEEYGLDLAQFHFPDSAAFTYDDLMPVGSLIVIQASENDANKENIQDDLQNHDYSVTELRSDGQVTDTERVSGQLISEALTQAFDLTKDKSDESLTPVSISMPMSSTSTSVSELHASDNQNMEESMPDEAQYLSLDSIDHLALHEVLHGNNQTNEDQSNALHHYQTMASSSIYEMPKELNTFCHFSTEIAP